MDFLESVGGILWGPWTPYVLLAAGVIFTVWSRFTQYTAMTHGIQVVRGIYDDPSDPGVINHFQALSAALSATVGLGNIGGVALAIGIGGPGALFWMWVVGFFGMALKTIEITLAMMYRNTDDPDNPHGGAMWVVHHVIGGKGGIWVPIAKILGTIFCITLIISSFTGGNMFQAWNVANLTESYFQVPKIATGIVMALIVGMVIIGGIKRIGQVAGKLVPFMCLLYIVSALTVLAANVTAIPGIFVLIFKSAFAPTGAVGAFVGGSIGFAFVEGMKRAIFSNEAGQGSAPIAHAAAKTGEPAREGIVGGIGPFVDTITICTITALVIISTGTWNREPIGDFGSPIAFEQVADAEIPTWNVIASEDATQLPSDRFGKWVRGSRVFLLAEAAGGTSGETQNNLVKVEGEITGPAGFVAQSELAIDWAPIELDEWEGAPTGLTLQSTEIYRDYDGAELTAHAFDRQFFGLGRWLVTLAAWLFAISTMISWSYYGEQGMIYMLGQRSVLYYKLLFLVGIIYAANWIGDTDEMIIFMDLGTGAMLWANIPIVLALGFLAVRSLDDYKRNLKAGKFKRHD
jgi:AGCS family alanine or glycine:cation symporter